MDKQDFISILREAIEYMIPREEKNYILDVDIPTNDHIYLKLLTLQKYLDSKAVILHDVLRQFNVRDASLIMEPFEIWHYVKINDDEFQLFSDGNQPINYTTNV